MQMKHLQGVEQQPSSPQAGIRLRTVSGASGCEGPADAPPAAAHDFDGEHKKGSMFEKLRLKWKLAASQPTTPAGSPPKSHAAQHPLPPAAAARPAAEPQPQPQPASPAKPIELAFQSSLYFPAVDPTQISHPPRETTQTAPAAPGLGAAPGLARAAPRSRRLSEPLTHADAPPFSPADASRAAAAQLHAAQWLARAQAAQQRQPTFEQGRLEEQLASLAARQQLIAGFVQGMSAGSPPRAGKWAARHDSIVCFGPAPPCGAGVAPWGPCGLPRDAGGRM